MFMEELCFLIIKKYLKSIKSYQEQHSEHHEHIKTWTDAEVQCDLGPQAFSLG